MATHTMPSAWFAEDGRTIATAMELLQEASSEPGADEDAWPTSG